MVVLLTVCLTIAACAEQATPNCEVRSQQALVVDVSNSNCNVLSFSRSDSLENSTYVMTSTAASSVAAPQFTVDTSGDISNVTVVFQDMRMRLPTADASGSTAELITLSSSGGSVVGVTVVLRNITLGSTEGGDHKDTSFLSRFVKIAGNSGVSKVHIVVEDCAFYVSNMTHRLFEVISSRGNISSVGIDIARTHIVASGAIEKRTNVYAWLLLCEATRQHIEGIRVSMVDVAMDAVYCRGGSHAAACRVYALSNDKTVQYSVIRMESRLQISQVVVRLINVSAEAGIDRGVEGDVSSEVMFWAFCAPVLSGTDFSMLSSGVALQATAFSVVLYYGWGRLNQDPSEMILHTIHIHSSRFHLTSVGHISRKETTSVRRCLIVELQHMKSCEKTAVVLRSIHVTQVVESGISIATSEGGEPSPRAKLSVLQAATSQAVSLSGDWTRRASKCSFVFDSVVLTSDVRNGTFIDNSGTETYGQGALTVAIFVLHLKEGLTNVNVTVSNCRVVATMGSRFIGAANGFFSATAALVAAFSSWYNSSVVVSGSAVVVAAIEFQSLNALDEPKLNCFGGINGLNVTAAIAVADINVVFRICALPQSAGPIAIESTNVAVMSTNITEAVGTRSGSEFVGFAAFVGTILSHVRVSVTNSGGGGAVAPPLGLSATRWLSGVVLGDCQVERSTFYTSRLHTVVSMFAFLMDDSALRHVHVVDSNSSYRKGYAVSAASHLLHSVGATCSLSNVSIILNRTRISDLGFASSDVRWNASLPSSVSASCVVLNGAPLTDANRSYIISPVSPLDAVLFAASFEDDVCLVDDDGIAKTTLAPHRSAFSSSPAPARSESAVATHISVEMTVTVSSLIAAPMALSINRLSLSPLCTLDAVGAELEVMSSPTRLQFGPLPAAAHRGAVIGNIALWCSTWLLAAGVWGIVCRVRRLPRRHAAAVLYLPGVLVVAVVLLFQQTVVSSVVLLSVPSPATWGSSDTAIGVFGLLVCCALMICVAALLCTRRYFHAASVELAPPQHTTAVSAWVSWVLMCRTQWKSERLHPHFVAQFGFLFTSATNQRQWWLAADIVCTVALGCIAGAVPSSAAGCAAVRWLFATVAVLWLVATLLCLPKNRRMSQASILLSNVVFAIVSVIGAVRGHLDSSEAPRHLDTAANVLTTGAACFCTAALLLSSVYNQCAKRRRIGAAQRGNDVAPANGRRDSMSRAGSKVEASKRPALDAATSPLTTVWLLDNNHDAEPIGRAAVLPASRRETSRNRAFSTTATANVTPAQQLAELIRLICSKDLRGPATAAYL